MSRMLNYTVTCIDKGRITSMSDEGISEVVRFYSEHGLWVPSGVKWLEAQM